MGNLVSKRMNSLIYTIMIQLVRENCFMIWYFQLAFLKNGEMGNNHKQSRKVKNLELFLSIFKAAFRFINLFRNWGIIMKDKILLKGLPLKEDGKVSKRRIKYWLKINTHSFEMFYPIFIFSIAWMPLNLIWR